MQGSHLVPRFGPTTAVVEAFLKQLRHVPQQQPHVPLPPIERPNARGRGALRALATPAHRAVAVQAAQHAVADVLQDLSWPPDTTTVQHYVEQTAPQAVAILVLRGYITPEDMADEYRQVYESGWRALFGPL